MHVLIVDAHLSRPLPTALAILKGWADRLFARGLAYFPV